MYCTKEFSKAKQSSPATRHEGAWRYSSYSFLTSALEGGEWSASRIGRALPWGKDPRYPLYRRLGVPQSRSGHRGQRKNPLLLPGSNPDRPVVQSVVRHCTDWATLAHGHIIRRGDSMVRAISKIKPHQVLSRISRSCGYSFNLLLLILWLE
jgi:hypothetical protein